jgi:hypothetical protein
MKTISNNIFAVFRPPSTVQDDRQEKKFKFVVLSSEMVCLCCLKYHKVYHFSFFTPENPE